ncbi:hypothetical protein [Microbacterium sp. BK668]|uniref:hypothetical protein n=1 Tax=Microbacterium sp. BK668 TaxID=2512118 RepID=UPI00105DDA6B|nr:hypothetical protein [Microbacterium sp. BK668]
MSDAPADSEGSGAARDVAADHLSAFLAPRQGRWWARALRSVATIAVGLLTFDLEAGPSATDLVVIRRDTGRPVIRRSAGTLREAGELLTRAREELASSTVEEFLTRWRER